MSFRNPDGDDVARMNLPAPRVVDEEAAVDLGSLAGEAYTFDRTAPTVTSITRNADAQEPGLLGRAGDVVARRSLDFYEAVARRLAADGCRP